MIGFDAIALHVESALHAGNDHANRKRRAGLDFKFVKMTRVSQVAVPVEPVAPVRRGRNTSETNVCDHSIQPRCHSSVSRNVNIWPLAPAT